MASFDPERIKGGWRLKLKSRGDAPTIVEVLNPRPDRGQIRATLTVLRDEPIHHRDTVNLTSESGPAALPRWSRGPTATTQRTRCPWNRLRWKRAARRRSHGALWRILRRSGWSTRRRRRTGK